MYLLFGSQNVVSYRNITTMKVSDPSLPSPLSLSSLPLISSFSYLPFTRSFIPRHLVYHLLGGLLSYDFLFSSNVLFSSSNFYLVISFFPRQFCLFYRFPLECHNFPHHWSYQLHFLLILTSCDVPKDLHLPSDYPTRSRASRVKISRLLILRRS